MRSNRRSLTTCTFCQEGKLTQWKEPVYRWTCPRTVLVKWVRQVGLCIFSCYNISVCIFSCICHNLHYQWSLSSCSGWIALRLPHIFSHYPWFWSLTYSTFRTKLVFTDEIQLTPLSWKKWVIRGRNSITTILFDKKPTKQPTNNKTIIFFVNTYFSAFLQIPTPSCGFCNLSADFSAFRSFIYPAFLDYWFLKSGINTVIMYSDDTCHIMPHVATHWAKFDTDLTKLQHIQKRLACLVIKSPPFIHSVLLLRSLYWLPVRFRILFKISLLIHKTLHEKQPVYLHSTLEASLSSRSLRSNICISLSVSGVKTNTGARAFHSCAPSPWNNLLLSVCPAISIATFKKVLNTHLLDLGFRPQTLAG